MGFFGDVKKGWDKMIEESKEKDKGKALYRSGKKLEGTESQLIKEGYIIAMKREQEKTAELENIKRETEKLKLEKRREEAKLDKLKIQEKIKSKRKDIDKIDDCGW